MVDPAWFKRSWIGTNSVTASIVVPCWSSSWRVSLIALRMLLRLVENMLASAVSGSCRLPILEQVVA